MNLRDTMFNPVQYFKEVHEELGKVSWPTRQQTIQKTVLVVISSVVVGLYIGSLDFVFTKMSQLFIK